MNYLSMAKMFKRKVFAPYVCVGPNMPLTFGILYFRNATAYLFLY